MTEKKKKVLFVSKYAFSPALTGAQRRTMQMFSALQAIGCEMVVITDQTFWDENPVSKRGLSDLRESGIDVRSEGCRPFTPHELTLMGRIHKLFGMIGKKPPGQLLESLFPTQKKWLNPIIEEVKPDIIYCTYLDSDIYIDHERWKNIRRVMDTVDLLSLNKKMWTILNPRLPSTPTEINLVDDEVLHKEFLEGFSLAPDPSEFTAYDKYDCTIAIVERESAVIRKNVKHSHVITIPMMQETIDLDNTYRGDPCMPSSNNPYNLQGILSFARHVLPKILVQEQEFCFHVVGPLSKLISPQQGLKLSEFDDVTGVYDVRELYLDAPFLLCPVFSGTGQQVKITQAMAHGVPVVAFREAADRAGVKHGENGFVADDAEEFAEYTIRLWRDRTLCAKLGKQAKELIARDYSMDTLAELIRKAV